MLRTEIYLFLSRGKRELLSQHWNASPKSFFPLFNELSRKFVALLHSVLVAGSVLRWQKTIETLRILGNFGKSTSGAHPNADFNLLVPSLTLLKKYTSQNRHDHTFHFFIFVQVLLSFYDRSEVQMLEKRVTCVRDRR